MRENLLSLNKNVLEVVVVGLPDEKWGQRICGFIRRDGNIQFSNLDKHCLESGMANFKRPKEYIFVKGNGNNDWENILIVAHKDATTISINGGGVSATINKGQYYLIEGAEYNSNGNMYVQTSNPVFTYQGIGANNSEANQSLFFVPPLSCENKGGVDNIADIQNIGSEIFTGGVTIVTNKGAIISINSKPISDFSPSGPFDVDGNTNYVTYRVTNLTGNISIDSSGELYCAYFNENGELLSICCSWLRYREEGSSASRSSRIGQVFCLPHLEKRS